MVRHILKLEEDISLPKKSTIKALRTLKEKGTFIVGISPGNNYFNEGTVSKIINFIRENGCHPLFMVTDGPSFHNFRALNYSIESAKRNARRQGLKLKGLCIQCGALPKEILDWDEVYKNADFKESLRDLTELFQDSESFRYDVLEATSLFLKSRIKGVISEDQKKTASNYLLEELSFLLSANQILGIESTSYLYHREWPVFEKLVNGEYDQIQRELGFFSISFTIPTEFFDASGRNDPKSTVAE